ncbi:hypothetical protein CKA32_006764 [Geitlerinema sp. FC II]|nr:hypothetical protein CKA32_006764 [Geitlerinema sp. FC II]
MAFSSTTPYRGQRFSTGTNDAYLKRAIAKNPTQFWYLRDTPDPQNFQNSGDLTAPRDRMQS